MEAEVLNQWLEHAGPSFAVGRKSDRERDMPQMEGMGEASPFRGAMSRLADMVSAPVQAANAVVNRFSGGAEGEIHESMMALEKSDIGFKFLVSAKNKAIEAYKETLRMG